MWCVPASFLLFSPGRLCERKTINQVNKRNSYLAATKISHRNGWEIINLLIVSVRDFKAWLDIGYIFTHRIDRGSHTTLTIRDSLQVYTCTVKSKDNTQRGREFGEDHRANEGGTKSVYNIPSSAGLAASRYSISAVHRSAVTLSCPRVHSTGNFSHRSR